MSDRKPLMAGNWKMHHTHLEAIQVVQKLSYRLDKKDFDDVDVVVCPAFTALRSVQTTLEGDRIADRARRAELPLRAAGRVHRRGERADARQAARAVRDRRALRAPPADRRDRRDRRQEAAGGARGRACSRSCAWGRRSRSARRARPTTFVAGQVRAALANLPADKAERCVVAYEPIWAIGTGRNATPDDANATIGVIRSTLRDMIGGTADEMRILYGGSMKPGNVADLMAMPEIDGGLVGGASLDPDDFARIIRFAK